MYSAFFYQTEPYARVHFWCSEGSASGGRQLVDQAVNLTSEPACRLLFAEHSSNAMYYYLFTISQRVEGWVDLGTAACR